MSGTLRPVLLFLKSRLVTVVPWDLIILQHQDEPLHVRAMLYVRVDHLLDTNSQSMHFWNLNCPPSLMVASIIGGSNVFTITVLIIYY